MPLIQQRGDSVIFAVKVHPKARRERIAGVLGDALKLEITAPPVGGKPTKLASGFSLIF